MYPFYFAKRITFFISVLIAQNAFSQTFNPTAPAQNFQLFAQNGITAVSGTTEGSVACGGDITLNGGITVASNTSGTFPTGSLNNSSNYGLVVGGQVVFAGGTNTQVNQGLLRVGSTTGTSVFYTDCNNSPVNLKLTPYKSNCNAAFNSNSSLQLQRQQASGTVTASNGLDFTTAFSLMTQYAATMKGYSNSSNAQLNRITIDNTNNPHVVLQDNKINVITLTATQLNNLNTLGSIIFDNKPAANRLLLFNIDFSGSISWNSANFAGLSDADGAFILFNFPGATTLTLQGSNPVYGTVFAPSADVTKSSAANLNGQVICKSFVLQNGRLNYQAYKGTLTSFTPAQITLPVKLENFGGNLFNNKVVLQWKVAQNETANSFAVEKSTNGIDFTTVGLVFATAQSGSENYSFSDGLSGKGYYRLKMTDQQNVVNYSLTLSFETQQNAGTTLTVLTNPVRDAIHFQFGAAEKGVASVSVYSLGGAKLFSKTITVEKGMNVLTMDTNNHLPGGVYLLEALTSTSRCLAKFVK